MLELEQAMYLGPAKVLQAQPGKLRLELPDEVVWALPALAFHYQAEPGDLVLAIGRDDAWYVIGILSGRGTSTFIAPGDVAIKAPRGKIELVAAEGVELRSPEVGIHCTKLEVMAQSVVERFVSAYRWVRETCELRAGQVKAMVDSCYRLRAGRIVERAKEDVTIDGKSINLG